jgi:hypothetical protein
MGNLGYGGVLEMFAKEATRAICCNAMDGRRIFVDCFEYSYVTAINIDGSAFNPLKIVRFLNQ